MITIIIRSSIMVKPDGNFIPSAFSLWTGWFGGKGFMGSLRLVWLMGFHFIIKTHDLIESGF
jgi:hypothetical protein